MTNGTGPIPMQGQKIQMTMAEIEALPHAVCKQCGFDNFIQTYKLKRISAFMSRSGRVEVIPMQSFVCAACHHQLTPKDMEDATNKSESELPDDAA
jgi:hypothetical protein